MGEEGKQEQTEEETKAGEKKEEKADGQEKKEEPKPPSPFVLFVDLHCAGCAEKIERSLSKIRGVEEVEIDMAKNEVTIKGAVEPQAVCNRIMKRTKRRAKVLSPLPEAEGEPMPEVVASQANGLATVELSVNMHCEACAGQLKSKILKMKGVRAAETELSSGKVTVTGTMDADRLVDYIYRRTRKQAKIVPQPEHEKPAEEKKEEEETPAAAAEETAKREEKKDETEKQGPPPEEQKKDGEAVAAEKTADEDSEAKEDVKIVEEQAMDKMMHYYQQLYVIERIPASQIFSDENPNACCIV